MLIRETIDDRDELEYEDSINFNAFDPYAKIVTVNQMAKFLMK